MLPIPGHLRNIFSPTGEDNTEYEVTGTLRCVCDSTVFRIRFFAGLEEGYPCLGKYGDDFGLVIKITCTDCLADFTLFDDSQHGWNGFTGKKILPIPERDMKPWYCPDCEDSHFQTELTIQSQGRDDFINELEIGKNNPDNSGFAAEDWVDAFEWISMTLHCTACGRRDENWLDHECM